MSNFSLSVLSLALSLVSFAFAPSAADAQSVEDSIVSMAHKYNGDVGIFALNLSNGDTVSYNADKLFPTASVIKIYVLGELLHDVKDGKLSMNEKVVLRDSDKVPGSGVLLFLHDGLELTLSDLSWLMIDMSDNVAANLLVDEIGGVESVTISFVRSA